MNTPVIGFTLDHEAGGEGRYSKLPWYAIRENYCASVSAAGGLPIALPYDLTRINEYTNLIDGLVIIGGDFDIPPAMYGRTDQHETIKLKPQRSQFEWDICTAMLDAQKPILGICGGQQMLNVVLGGGLIQHIPDSIANCLEHEQPTDRHEVGHSVAVKKGSLLHSIVGSDEIGVNSAHHQAADGVGEDVIISGIAPDGVIEAIELPVTKHPFCLGVQWHPEYHVSDADNKIWDAFIHAAK